MIQLLGVALPLLITVAEKVFGKSGDVDKSKGPVKKQFVMSIVSSLLDKVSLPDVLKGVDEKKFLLDLISVTIDNMVPELTKSE